jgi:hypothetical protein
VNSGVLIRGGATTLNKNIYIKKKKKKKKKKIQERVHASWIATPGHLLLLSVFECLFLFLLSLFFLVVCSCGIICPEEEEKEKVK